MDCCFCKRTYVTLTDGTDFWYYPVFIESCLVNGYRWDGHNWVENGIDLRKIRWFNCCERTKEGIKKTVGDFISY
ncbi:hypothetical protein CN520_00590 [Bacillus cereus]|uniref:hypothetical protein n=1 Tax=Bacillus cereus group TaxID=86661 RepID=UPI000BEE4B4D|nr:MULTISPECIES: hypothetical protein [Bacillus cereus group]PDZ39795.1 hypothetical protein CON18_13105 [Bacillus cereus]PES11094.1 hypothetical protein CN494_22580 [Bacillus cereus]PET44035.1 hypothetical protein CN520_00590 [Bacillus cereus]PEX18083.1 hypothetical protein CN452_22820 [Bacillus cereus]PFA14371.1 hypothetical protein CN377_10760 [Bacillus cereus]